MKSRQHLAWLMVVSSLVLSASFFYWAEYAVYDPVKLEAKGHHAYASKQYQQAYNAFSRAVDISAQQQEIDNAKLSLGYRYVASSAYQLKEYSLALQWLARSLRHKPDNKEARQLLKQMLFNKQISVKQVEKAHLTKTDTEAVDFIFTNSLGRAAGEPGRQAWIDQQEILAAARGNAEQNRANQIKKQ